MCGVVGLFAGCPAAVTCPKALLTAAPPPDDGEYRSPLRSWFERAAVRTAPRRELDDSPLLFPPELVPIARHPLVVALGADVRDQVLAQHLYRYLDFTAKLEHLVVNRTALAIAHGTVGVELPEEMRFDAYKIYCDEAYHALFSYDLARQARARSGIEPRLPAQPWFLRRLAEIQQTAPAELRPLVELLFVIVSETLISATLADVPADPDVAPAVRDAIRDHAIDEGRHHAYFAAFLRRLWGSLDRPTRRAAAVLVPRLVDAFLRPDVDAARAELLGYGMARDDVEHVLADVYAEPAMQAFTRGAAQHTVRLFAELGALDVAAADAEFRRYKLVA